MFTKFRNNVEWSLNVKTKVLVKFSFLWLFWVFISVDDIPLLVDLSVLTPYKDVSVFGINTILYIHYLSFLIDNESILESEHLPSS